MGGGPSATEEIVMESTHTSFGRSKKAFPKSRASALAGAVAVGAFALAFANPAAARNDFANAFERELGRIAAHDVATVARVLLPPLPLIVRDVHYRPVRPHVHRPAAVVVSHRHYAGCEHDRGWNRGHRIARDHHDHGGRYDRRDRHDRNDRYDRRDPRGRGHHGR